MMSSVVGSMKKQILSIYPLFQCYRWLCRFVGNWKYHAIVKCNDLLLYEEPREVTLHRELLAIELYRSLRASNDWMPDSLLPVAGAADYKILYVVARLLAEYGLRDIIEFGAGQSTTLLSAFACQTDANVVTIEHDAGWTAVVASKGLPSNHRLRHCPLVEQASQSIGTCNWYDFSKSGLTATDKFELIIVDGPVGLPRYSRVGIVDHFANLHAPDWVVVWDDLHRIGDLQTFALFLNRLRDDGIEHRHVIVNGMKRIGIVHTGKFDGVASYF